MSNNMMNSSSSSEENVTRKASASKKRKTTSDKEYNPAEEEEVKAGAIQRVWSPADELKLLQALKEQTDRANMTMLYETVRNCLEFDVQKKQVADKVGKLRRKFKEISEGRKAAGSDKHSVSVYQLCQQVWGGKEKQVAAAADEDRVVYKKKYPLSNRNITYMYPELALGEIGSKIQKSSIRRNLVKYLSEEELEEMEQDFVECDLRDMEGAYLRMKVVMKHKNQIDKASRLSKESK
ncbi:putative transcription factor GeBP family [Helianthus annuus]|nr:putative transcription factor GeBP family [Helianthus annuus]